MTEPLAGCGPAVINRLVTAIKDRNIQSFVACFAPDYRSERPLHPADTLHGRDQT
jgi:hypothetical protein